MGVGPLAVAGLEVDAREDQARRAAHELLERAAVAAAALLDQPNLICLRQSVSAPIHARLPPG